MNIEGNQKDDTSETSSFKSSNPNGFKHGKSKFKK